MKINKSKIRKIIKEELSRIAENQLDLDLGKGSGPEPKGEVVYAAYYDFLSPESDGGMKVMQGSSKEEIINYFKEVIKRAEDDFEDRMRGKWHNEDSDRKSQEASRPKLDGDVWVDNFDAGQLKSDLRIFEDDVRERGIVVAGFFKVSLLSGVVPFEKVMPLPDVQKAKILQFPSKEGS